MAVDQHDIHSLAVSIRGCALSPVSPDTPDIKPLARGIQTLLDRKAPLPVEEIGLLRETALNLSRILQTSKDSRTIRHCLRTLLGMGRFGRILSARFIQSRSVSMRELATTLTAMKADAQLALAHEMLLDYPGTYDKPMLDFLSGLMKPMGSAQPETIAPFVAELGRQDTSLAFPVRQVIMHGLFGEWIRTRLETGAGEEELDDLCHMVSAIDDPALARTLATSIGVGFIVPTPLALHTIQRVAEARDKAVQDMYVKVLKGAKPELAGACIDGIIAQQSPATGKLLASIRLKMPSLRKVAAARVPLLNDTMYAAYLAAIPKKQRDQAREDAFSALMAVAPDFVENLTGTSVETQSPPVAMQTLEPAVTIDECPKPGLIAKLLGKGHKPLEKRLSTARNVRDAEVQCSAVDGENLDGRELIGLTLVKSTFSQSGIIRSTLSRNAMAECAFTDVECAASTFTLCDFTGSDFANTTFKNCTFTDCNFTSAAFSSCRFTACRFQGCTMNGSAFVDAKLTRCAVTTSVLTGVTLHSTTLTSCRFEESDLSGSEIVSTKFSGVEMVNCILTHANLVSAVFHSVDMPGTTVSDCGILASDLPHALFLKDRMDDYQSKVRRLERGRFPDPHVAPPETAAKVLKAWSREVTFFSREERMLTNNRHRLARAIAAIERDKQIYLRILPHLLNTDVFERRFELEGVPKCNVWGYVPSLTALELADQFFPAYKPSRGKADVEILAVYAMGSLGSVAQTTSSDIDCWVCYEGNLDREQLAGLNRKLDALGLWAESEFGLEAHFFPMHMDDVRANRFSSGDDEESSGSAQALLLKEEFYRTALRVAGKNLAWWATPPGVDRKTYDIYVQAARRYPLTGRPRLEDFGHLAPVPPSEYFGGSLWQMVKAVHSPFKSVLKLGLLETYADPKTSNMALCDRIKLNIFLHRRGVRRIDPYAALFSTLRSYYASHGDTEAAELLTESFRFKANLCDIPFFLSHPARLMDASLIDTMFGRGAQEPEALCSQEDNWSFDKSLEMGSSVRQYMVNTYQRIQGTLSQESGAIINPEDLTRMGRRIGANFSRKKHKVMRVPFMGAKKGISFPILHFSADKAPGKKPIWTVRGGSAKESKKSAESLQLLHRSGDPIHMFAWLLANRLYVPKSLMQADRTIAPIALTDLQKLLPAMHEFFPFDKTFERDINDGLESERVLRVFFIFNLTSGPDSQKIEQAGVIYTTNWGEMYCRTFTNPGPVLEKQPSRFLSEHLDHPVDGVPEMILFLPKGAQCKRINLI